MPQFIGDRLPGGLKKAGHDYQACCPFHEEKSASFTVSQTKGFYHCFGCGAHGNAIGFLIEYEGKGFIEAVKEVAALVGMEVPSDRPEKSKEQKQEAARYMRACDAMKAANIIYAEKYAGSTDAQVYLTERGLTEQSIAKFGLGYAPEGWNTVTDNKMFTREVLIDSGLATQKEGSTKIYDRFRDRITFPIYGHNNENIIGFGGRAIHGQDPKYLNSPECMLFKKGDHLYGVKQALDSIRHNKRAFVFEGYMDVVMVSQYGVENVVASLGTSVTEGQMRKLFSLAPRITFCMDGDKAGRKAAWRAAENILPLLDENHCVDFMFMPNGMDPDDFVRANGKEGFEKAALSARTLTDYVLDVFVKYTDMKNGESLARYLSKANEMADKIKPAVIKLSFQKRIAELAGISLDTMLEMLKEKKAAQAARIAPAESKPSEHIQLQATTPAASPVAQVLHIAPPHVAPEISIAAKMLGIAAVHTHEVAVRLDTDYLAKFLNAADKEMLFPLLAYLKVNERANGEAIVASLGFNPHIALISTLVSSAGLLGTQFNAVAEARSTLERFRAMEQVWAVVKEDRKKKAEAA